MALVDLSIGPDVIPPDWTRVGPLVAYRFDPSSGTGHGGLLVYHWCEHRLWAGRAGYDADPAFYRFWAPAGVGAHELVSVDPLHLEPSVYWPDCCGLHGFIRAGRWVDA